ncbi:MAG: rhomboid family intramembrane serine protease [Rhizobiales bacterium]|nr:rhomboid family intramembrane serine protease [Hyphomicrobiales bacterium]MBI3673170.1 rhomboid family intramembrane serine protease [Hyphomicrobiales bacterium]
MFVPLYDGTPLRVIRFQYVTIAIILANVAVYLATGAFTSDRVIGAIATGYGVVPGELTGNPTPWHAMMPIPRPLTLVTYMFLHAGWWHLIGNMLFLWVFADNIEDAYGYGAFALFYLFCGIAGALTHVLMAPVSADPLIGASGAVSGVLGAYAVLFPRARVWILLFMRLPLRIGAIWVLGGWFLLQVFTLFTAADMQVALWAHIGGFVTGSLVTLALRQRLLIRIGD